MNISKEIENIERFFQSIVDDGSRMGYVRIFRRKNPKTKQWEWRMDAQRLVPGDDRKMEGPHGVESLEGYYNQDVDVVIDETVEPGFMEEEPFDFEL